MGFIYNNDHKPARYTFECDICGACVHQNKSSEPPEEWNIHDEDDYSGIEDPCYPATCSLSCEADWHEVVDGVLATAKSLFRAKLKEKQIEVQAKLALAGEA